MRQTYCHSSTPTEHTHTSHKVTFTHSSINQSPPPSFLKLICWTNPPNMPHPASLPAPQTEAAVTSLLGKWGISQVTITAAASRLLESFLADAAGSQLAPRLKCSSTVPLVLSNSHCWVAEEGLHVFMKTRRSFGLLSIQLLLTGWYRLLSWRTTKGGKTGRTLKRLRTLTSQAPSKQAYSAFSYLTYIYIKGPLAEMWTLQGPAQCLSWSQDCSVLDRDLRDCCYLHLLSLWYLSSFSCSFFPHFSLISHIVW